MTDQSNLPETKQQELIPSSEMPDDVFAVEEQAGNFTGERLAVRDQHKYKQIVSLLAEGLSLRMIARILHVSTNTIQAVREREPEAIETIKNTIAASARSASRICVERITELLLDKDSKLSGRDMAIIMGVLTDKAELLSGGVTERIGRQDDRPGHQALISYLESLRPGMGLGGQTAAKQAKQAEVYEADVQDVPEDVPEDVSESPVAAAEGERKAGESPDQAIGGTQKSAESPETAAESRQKATEEARVSGSDTTPDRSENAKRAHDQAARRADKPDNQSTGAQYNPSTDL